MDDPPYILSGALTPSKARPLSSIILVARQMLSLACINCELSVFKIECLV